MGRINLDIIGIIGVMRSGFIPLTPPEEAFLAKVDKKDSSEIKLTKKDKKALETFTSRMRLGLSREDDAEVEIEDPRPYPRIIIVPKPEPAIPIPDRETVPLPRKVPALPGQGHRFPESPLPRFPEVPLPFVGKGIRYGRFDKDDAEVEIEDPRPYPRIVIVPRPEPATIVDPIPIEPEIPVESSSKFLRSGY